MKWGIRKAEKAQGRADRQQKVADKRKAEWDKSRAKKGKAPGTVNTKKRITRGQREANAVNSQRIADRLQKKADKKLAKVDGKWEKQIYTAPGAIAVHNAMADHFNSRIGALNDKHPDAHLDHPDTDATKAYIADITKLENEGYARAVRSVHGSSPSGKKEAVFVDDEQGQRIVVRNKSVQHAEDDEPDLVMHLNVENGKAVSGNKAELDDTVTHELTYEESLAHYGVPGMKWGVRKSDSSKSGPREVTTTQKKPGQFVKAKGGEKHPAHEDAVKAVVARQKAKGSTTDALSNAELQAAVTRMNLEAQFKRLDQENDRRSKGARFIAGLLGAPKTGKKEKNPMDSHEAAGTEVRNAVAEALAKKNAA